MSLVFAYDTYHLIALHVISIFILLFVNFSIWLKAKRIPLLYAYLAVQGILFLWMVSKILKTVAPNAQSKFAFVVCQYAGVCFLGEAFLIFAFLYATGTKLAQKHVVLMAMPSLAFFLMLLTNPYHMLFYSRFDFWGDTFGPVFYLQQAYNYILILAGIALCSRAFGRQFGEKRIQALLLSIAILVPLITNVIYVFGWFKPIFGFAPPCDITPVSCNISLMIFALATFRYRFFDDVKIARRNALAFLPDGILLIDGAMRIVDFNDTFKNLYENGCLYAKDEESVIRRVADAPRLVRYERAAFLARVPCPLDITYETDNRSYYRIICRAVLHNGTTQGVSMRFIDLTLKQAIQVRMESKNNELSALNRRLEEQAQMCRNLAIARTRNFIAGEVHDVLGHSVVLVISLLEVARFSYGKPGFDLSSFIGRAAEFLQDCLKRSSILWQPDATVGGLGLIGQLEGLTREVEAASVHAELTVSGSVPELSQECGNTIFKLCREGITNAIRHGKADRIDLILRFLPEGIEVYIIDNGAGCEEVSKGMGIIGMERRLEALGGALTCGSFGGRGFCLQAVLPVRSDHF